MYFNILRKKEESIRLVSISQFDEAISSPPPGESLLLQLTQQKQSEWIKTETFSQLFIDCSLTLVQKDGSFFCSHTLQCVPHLQTAANFWKNFQILDQVLHIT